VSGRVNVSSDTARPGATADAIDDPQQHQYSTTATNDQRRPELMFSEARDVREFPHLCHYHDRVSFTSRPQNRGAQRKRRVSDISNKSSTVAGMGDRLATIGVGRKWGGAAVVAGSPLGPHLTQCGLGRGLSLYQVASSSIQQFGHNCRNATLHRIGTRAVERLP